jgi:4-hydroxybenzoate polyprenyltransferase
MLAFVYAVKTSGVAAGGNSPWWWATLLVQVILCMVFARNVAMGFNRWADRDIDAKNPRTADREIPAGKISARAALWFVNINALLFVGVASTINLLTALLSPVALGVVMFYSYCKRFTSLAHMVLGLSLGIAPVGAYIAVTGEFALEACILSLVVITWTSGFDIIYALQDRDFDREQGLHSIPAKFSPAQALAISIALHAVSIASLVWFATYLPSSVWTWAGVAAFAAILCLEHILVTPTRTRHIGIAFGTLNGLASMTLAVLVIIGLLTA